MDPELSHSDVLHLLELQNEEDAQYFEDLSTFDLSHRELDPLLNVDLNSIEDLLAVCDEDLRRDPVENLSPLQSGEGSGTLIQHQQVNHVPQVIHHPNLHRTEYRTSFNIHHLIPNSAVDILTLGASIDRHFDDIINPIIATASPQDIVSVVISHPSLIQGNLYRYMKVQKFISSAITNKIAKIVQSRAEFLPHGQFNMDVGILKSVSGGARTQAPQSVSQARAVSNSIIHIPSVENECGHSAIFIAVFRLRKDWKGIDKKEWDNIRATIKQGRPRHQLFAHTLNHIAHVNAIMKSQVISIDKAMDMDDIEVYAKALDVEIVVFTVHERSSKTEAKLLRRSNFRKTEEQTIFLELLVKSDGTNHYNVITNISGYLGVRKFCFVCFKGVQNNVTHFCRVGCPGCLSKDVCESDSTVVCHECGRKCNGEACLAKHRGTNFCKSRSRCSTCFIYLTPDKKKKHKCFEYECQKCNETYTESPHHCFMKPIKPSDKDRNNIVIVAFDIESKFVNHLDVTVHEPDLLCALIVCNECYKRDNIHARRPDGSFEPLKDEITECPTCKGYRKEFTGRDCVAQFTTYLYDDLARHVAKHSKDTDIRVFAHNFKGYDGRFVLRDLFNREKMESERVIMQGSKIACLKVANITFQDSLNLFQCPLSKLPKSFQFEERVLKGTFPFLFNTPENENYIGKTPDIKYYGFDNMKPGDQAKLIKYHETIKDRTDFDLEKEKLDYCRDDTEILLISIQEFRHAFIDITDFDPIRQYFTLPSMSYGGFRRQFLQPNTIGITPVNGYGEQRKNSMIATAYLDLLEKQIQRRIDREHRVGYAYADGFDKETNTIYEINGCHWHGCPKCHPFDRDRKNPGTEMSYNKAYELYTEKMEFYENLKQVLPGLSVFSKWECEIRTEMKHDREFKIDMNNRMDYYRKLEKVGRCDLRESYFGGRTNNRKFFGVCDGEEEWFEYVDFTR